MIKWFILLPHFFTLFFLVDLVNASVPIQCIAEPDKPCALALTEGVQPWYINFTQTLVSEDEYIIQYITLVPPGDRQDCYTIRVPDMTPQFIQDPVSLYAQDLNQDGFLDIWFVTDQGAANTVAAYWLYKPESDQFVFMGRYPWLRLNSALQTLQSYERYGHGGKIYTKNLYRIENHAFILIEQEKQIWDSDKKRYIKKTTKKTK